MLGTEVLRGDRSGVEQSVMMYIASNPGVQMPSAGGGQARKTTPNGSIAIVAGSAVTHTLRFDATDRIVLPGFVDTHRHTWQTAFRGVDAPAARSPD